MNLTEQFQQLRNQYELLSQQYRRRYNRVAWVRVALFLAAAGGGFLLWRQYGASVAAIGIVVCLSAFVYSIRLHNQLADQRNHYQFLAFINQDEEARLQNRFLREETGQAFDEPHHPYTGDLDIFGHHSLYRVLNRTHTYYGARTLASWLKQSALPDEIRARQAAVHELEKQLDWRQTFEATAMHYPAVGQSPEGLLHWMKDKAALPGWVKIARWLPVVTIPLFVGWVLSLVPAALLGLLVLVHVLVLRTIGKTVTDIANHTNAVSGALLAYSQLIEQIEKPSFAADKLRDLQAQLRTGNTRASTAIGMLGSALRNLSYRDNAYFYALVGVLSLWDLQYLIRIEAWKEQHHRDLARWLDVVAEWEALNSLAGFAYGNPGFATPRISSAAIELRAQEVGHVLIHPDKRVTNSITLTGEGKTAVITGSNMSGKSTFLRTVGVNIVLALAGARVCAKAFTISAVQVFTSMRTQDSLEESVSSFYAELKRLQQLLAQIEKPQPVLYFLDEILKGTNSQDRHAGARALMLQLHRYHASGFISTHDLELGSMAGQHPEYVHNYSFNSEFVDGKLLFDYTLREGVCRSFNASQLMRQIGIEL